MTWYVYALKDPRDGAIRYVGKSVSPESRMLAHLSARASGAMKRWLSKIGAPPAIEVLSEHATEGAALDDERRRIRELREAGHVLVNRRPGGSETALRIKRFSGMGRRVFEAREGLGMDQVRLAQKSGVPQCSISRLENARSATVAADAAVLLARALDVSVEWLVTGSERASKASAA